MDLNEEGEEGDINFNENENEENLIQNEAEIDEQELDINNGEQGDEEDSNSDHRFPYIEDTSWIHWFCKLEGNEFFVEIDESFIKNKANLIGIKCKDYLNKILSSNAPAESSLNEDLEEELQGIKEVYGLIHKRFITTSKGLALMREKYLNGVFGRCPRVVCNKQVLIPVGLSEDLKYSKVKVYCPICCQVYKPSRYKGRNISLDGAYFGTSFAQIFFMNYPDLKPKIKEEKLYIPKLYGFKIFGMVGSKYYCKTREELFKKMDQLSISHEED
jgi:casein kinase II subunit beta